MFIWGAAGVEAPATPWTRYELYDIPIPFPTSYDELLAFAVKGNSVGPETICPRCLAKGELVYTGCWVERNTAVLGADFEARPECISIPLALCKACGCRPRVLPRELPAYKRFSLPVMEKAGRLYVQQQANGPSLRVTSRAFGKEGPCYSSIHRWLSGLGERALDRGAVKTVPAYASLRPACALVAESRKHLKSRLQQVWQRHFEIPDWKYRSPKRGEQLEACARLLNAADFLFPESVNPLTEWEGWLIARFNVPSWAFPTGFRCTDLQHPQERNRRIESASSKTKTDRKEFFHEERGPPGGMLAVRTDKSVAGSAINRV